jgi:hypothetical protein
MTQLQRILAGTGIGLFGAVLVLMLYPTPSRCTLGYYYIKALNAFGHQCLTLTSPDKNACMAQRTEMRELLDKLVASHLCPQ